MSENNAVAIVPMMDLQEYDNARSTVEIMVSSKLKENKDFGIIPGTSKTDRDGKETATRTLLKPGAEKLNKLFGLTPIFQTLNKVEDWENNFVFYEEECSLLHVASDKLVAKISRTANNREKSFQQADWNKKDAQGRPGKKAGDAFEVANNVKARAQKRALVAITLMVTGASEFFDEGGADDTPKIDKVTGEILGNSEKREILLAKLFASAAERGFSPEEVKTRAYAAFKVDSLTKVSDNNLTALTTRITTMYQPVVKGEKPKLYLETPVGEKKADQTPAQQALEVFGEQPEDPEVVAGEVVGHPEVESVDIRECAGCHKKFKRSEMANGMFCGPCKTEKSHKTKTVEAAV